MRDYGVVSPQIWIGKTGKSLRGDMPAQIVALYLMTSPHANMIGVYYCGKDTIAKETGLSLEGASEALARLIEGEFCAFDEETEEVFVKRMAAFQIGEQLDIKDNRCKGIARELEKVSSDVLRSAFHAIYSVAFHLPELPGAKSKKASPSKAPSKPRSGSGPEAGKKTVSAGKLPTCPVQEIVSLYHEVLPEMVGCVVMDEAREKAIRDRWHWILTTNRPDGTPRATDKEQGLAWLRDYFERARANDFLMGRTPRDEKHKNWKPDIEFMMKSQGLKQVMEKTEVYA